MSTWWSGWSGTGRVVLDAVGAYAAVVVILRVSGKRTLAKLNAFDFVVTIALGSVLASVITSGEVPLLSGVLAVALLAGLQAAVAAVAARSSTLHRAVTSRPVALVRDGRIHDDALASQRVSRTELAAAARRHGLSDFADAALVVLETDGSISVLTEPPTPEVLGEVDARGVAGRNGPS
jgi:uncharacterized membrane protein YcaP (DUF421 family)